MKTPVIHFGAVFQGKLLTNESGNGPLGLWRGMTVQLLPDHPNGDTVTIATGLVVPANEEEEYALDATSAKSIQDTTGAVDLHCISNGQKVQLPVWMKLIPDTDLYEFTSEKDYTR